MLLTSQVRLLLKGSLMTPNESGEAQFLVRP